MPNKTTSRLRELLEQLDKAQHQSDGLAQRARLGIAGMMRGGELRPAGPSGSGRKKKAGKKKR